MKFINNSLRSKIKKDNGIYRHVISMDTTVKVTDFYSDAPFPNYQGLESKLHLRDIVENNPFLNDLKNTIGLNKSLIEVGSGTSQLSIAMAIGTNNLVVAMDPTIESLQLGQKFAEKIKVSNVLFLNADIFDNPIEDNFFDCVWCSGVLHHTKDSRKGFEIISKWVKPNGLIIIGVYNSIGRLRTNFRQVIYNLLGRSRFARKLVSLIDPYLRKNLSEDKEVAWFRDQYEHPVERKHTLDEVINWFDQNGVDFMGSIPSPNFDFKKITEMEGRRGTYFQRVCAQLSMLFSNLGGEGGLCIVIGRKIKK